MIKESQVLEDVAWEGAVCYDVVRCLDIEGFLDFGVWRNKKMEED